MPLERRTHAKYGDPSRVLCQEAYVPQVGVIWRDSRRLSSWDRNPAGVLRNESWQVVFMPVAVWSMADAMHT